MNEVPPCGECGGEWQDEPDPELVAMPPFFDHAGYCSQRQNDT